MTEYKWKQETCRCCWTVYLGRGKERQAAMRVTRHDDGTYQARAFLPSVESASFESAKHAAITIWENAHK